MVNLCQTTLARSVHNSEFTEILLPCARGVRFLRSLKAAPDCRASSRLSITPVSSPSASSRKRILKSAQPRADLRKKKKQKRCHVSTAPPSQRQPHPSAVAAGSPQGSRSDLGTMLHWAQLMPVLLFFHLEMLSRALLTASSACRQAAAAEWRPLRR